MPSLKPEKRLTSDQVLSLIKKKGLVRSKDLQSLRFAREYLKRLEKNGKIEKIARGVYLFAQSDLKGKEYVVAAAAKIPRGVICLLSALQWHGLTTQTPFEIWMAIENKARLPK